MKLSSEARTRLGHDDKAIVFGVIERGGDIVTRSRLWIVQPVRLWSRILWEFAKDGSRIVTDEWSRLSICSLSRHGYEHNTVDHSAKEYGGVTLTPTQSSCSGRKVKRGINGTYVWVSKKHLQTYLREFEYRHNLRQQPCFDVRNFCRRRFQRFGLGSHHLQETVELLKWFARFHGDNLRAIFSK